MYRFRWPASSTLRHASCRHPMVERKAAKAAEEDSFQSVARVWLEHWQNSKSSRHADYVKRRMEADILPCLGARPVAAIEAPELVSMVKAIEARRRARHCQARPEDGLTGFPLRHCSRIHEAESSR